MSEAENYESKSSGTAQAPVVVVATLLFCQIPRLHFSALAQVVAVVEAALVVARAVVGVGAQAVAEVAVVAVDAEVADVVAAKQKQRKEEHRTTKMKMEKKT